MESQTHVSISGSQYVCVCVYTHSCDRHDLCVCQLQESDLNIWHNIPSPFNHRCNCRKKLSGTAESSLHVTCIEPTLQPEGNRLHKTKGTACFL